MKLFSETISGLLAAVVGATLYAALPYPSDATFEVRSREVLTDAEIRILLEQVVSRNDSDARERLLEAGVGEHPWVKSRVRDLVDHFKLETYSERQSAYMKLYTLGDLAIPTLLEFLSDPDGEVRLRAQALTLPPVVVLPLATVLARVSTLLEREPEKGDLEELAQEVDCALFDNDPGLIDDLAKKLGHAVGQRMLGRSSFESEERWGELDRAITVAGEGILEVVAPGLEARGVEVKKESVGLRIVKKRGRWYRLSISEWSFLLTPVWEQSREDKLGECLHLSPRAANGRKQTYQTDRGNPIDEAMTFSLWPHHTWIIGDPDDLRGREVRYHVRGSGFGVTTTGDALAVSSYLAENLLGYEWSDLNEMVEWLRQPTRQH